jgi:Short C-terminal domain
MEVNARKRASWSNPAPTFAAPAAPAAPTVPEQLQQLADLRDRGVITAAEFEAKKAQLLERM